ncbi:hypothetical protein BH10CHL1_BH10CHL1_09470 [soil metagenome]
MTLIRTPDHRLHVFVSSTIQELAEERKAAREAILRVQQVPVLFEMGARPYAPRDLYRAYLEQSQIFVGIYWQRYGWVAPGMEISGLEDEYQLSGDRPKLIYVKSPADQREARLEAMIDQMKEKGVVSFQRFSTAAELSELITNDLALLFAERFEAKDPVAAAPDVAVAPPSNLPVLRTPFIDREQESAIARTVLLQPEYGLLTLTGPGGVGKTRLAIRVADQVKDEFADGVYFVPLSTLTDPAQVLPALAQTLEVRETGQLLLDSLKAYLRNKHMLLVLDNFEQVIAAASQVKELLSACPKLKILATSRTSLHIREEKELSVPPLALPDCAEKPDVVCLLQAPAMQLFVQRVQEVKPDFALKADNAAIVAEICQRLDGLPLALELAAARLKIFSPATLLAHLEQPLDTLVGGARDLPGRQQTLRNTIEWSYNLLEQSAKVLLRRLTIFARSWTLEDAEQVCNNAGDLGSDMLDELEMLVDNNLLKRADGPDGEPRFTMLHTIRIYARQQLVASGEEPLLCQRHAAYLIQLAEAAEPFLTSGRRGEYLAHLDAMLDDVRLALHWCNTTASEVETGLRLAGAFNWFWYLRGYVREGREWLEQLLAQATPALANSIYQAEARFGAGALACIQGDFANARQQLSVSRTIYAAIGDQRALANVMTFQGIVALSQGELASARELCTESAAQFHLLGDAWAEAFALNWLGEILFVMGDEATAQVHCEKSLALFRQIGDSWGTAMPLHVLANMAWVRSDYAAAYDLFAESGALLHEAGDQWGYTRSLAGSAAAALHQKNYTQAKSVFQVVLPLWEELGNEIGLISCLIGLAEIFSAEEQSSRAVKILSNADVLLRKNGFPMDGVPSAGAILLDTVDQNEFKRTLDLARAKLNQAQFTAAWSQGQEMTLEQIMGEAVEGQGSTAEDIVSI